MHDIISELQWRGLIHQTTDANLSSWLLEKSRTVYAGFDPTSDSLHVGNLMPLMLLRRFQRAGHRPIALAGGATGMIGDPSGKSAERNLLSLDRLEANLQSIELQLASILNFSSGDNKALLVNNHDWMRRFSYLDFLRDVGKHFPVNVMIAKDSVKGRLDRDDDGSGGGGISYTEFSYMLLQAYDFVHLQQAYDCQLQVGGSDQWGNITSGIDLGRRMFQLSLQGLTCPLLTKADGSKMGKTESGSIWLSADKTSPYAFYQYWINVADADAGKCLRFLTELDQSEIDALDTARDEQPHQRDSQKKLAAELTLLIHGESGLAAARQATDILFGAEINDLNDRQLNDIFVDVPSQELSWEQLDAGVTLIDALHQSGLTKSKGESRRVIQEGGAYVNNRRRTEIEERLSVADLASETVMVLRRGKRKYALLKFKK